MSSNNYQLLLSDLLKSLEEKGIDVTKLNLIEEKDEETNFWIIIFIEHLMKHWFYENKINKNFFVF